MWLGQAANLGYDKELSLAPVLTFVRWSWRERTWEIGKERQEDL